MAVNNLTADEQMTALKAYVPKSEQSARVYIELVKSQVLGYKKDKDGSSLSAHLKTYFTS